MNISPAHAGVIPANPLKRIPSIAFPRACGGDPTSGTYGPKSHAFSPHTRG